MKKRWSKVVAALIMVLLVNSLGACEQTLEEASETKEDVIEIGICFDTFVVERWERDRDIFVATANDLGAKVDVQNPNGVVEEQISQLEYFIEKGVDVIVVVPIDAASLTDVIGKAKKKGIKVISYDRLVDGADVDLYISFDNKACGACMANGLSSKLSAGDEVMMICGPTTDGNATIVAEGFQENMSAMNVSITDCVYLDEWKSELAYEYVTQHIDMIRNHSIKAIMCGNDNLATQVVYALSENRLAGSVLVVGQDADLDACQRIVEGTQYSTVYKPIDTLAQQAAVSAVDMAKGNEIVYDEVVNNGFADIPYIKLSPTNVTADNMDSVIVEDGFHSKEDIYMNY